MNALHVKNKPLLIELLSEQMANRINLNSSPEEIAMPGITSINIKTSTSFVSPFSNIHQDSKSVKKPVKAIGLSTLLIIGVFKLIQ